MTRRVAIILGFMVSLAAASSCRTAPPRPPGPPKEPQAAPQDEGATEQKENGEQPGDAETYEDPQGRFSAPIPPKWTIEQHDGYATAVGPDAKIKVHLIAAKAAPVDETIATSWPKVHPELAPEPIQTLRPPASEGLEDITVVNYKMGEERYVKQAIGWRAGETIYLTLIEGELEPIQKRGSQVQLITSGFQKSTMQQRDLSDVKPAKLDEQKLAKFDRHIQEMVELFDIPGAAVGVVQDGKVVYNKGFGTQQKDGAQVTPDTLMMIGSTSKTMTTMLMATAVDDGKMQWDTPAQKLLPQFSVEDADLSKKITMQNLVCACTGVPRRDYEIIFNFEEMSAEDIVQSLSTFEFFTDFGESFQYSNQMVATGGYATAAALGAKYGNLHDGYVEAMNQRVFGPIGMSSTTLSFDKALKSGKAATPHAIGLDLAYQPIDVDPERFVVPLAPGGAVWSTTRDMTRYLITELNRGVAPSGERVVSAKNLTHTWQPQVEINAQASYGLGWIVADYKGQRMISHGGNTLGFTSELAFLPDAGIGITILSNAGVANDFSQAVRNRLFELAFDLEPNAAEQAKFSAKTASEEMAKLQKRLQKLDAAAVKPYLGTYHNAKLGDVELRMDQQKLVVDAGEFASEVRPMKSEQTGELVYTTVDPPVLGAQLKLAKEEGQPVIIFGEGVNAYTFVPKK